MNPLDTFLAALAAMPPEMREMAMDKLRERVCMFCGADDPDCPCWCEEAAVPS